MADLDLRNSFGPLANIESTLHQLLDLLRAPPNLSPVQQIQIPSPSLQIDHRKNGGNTMGTVVEDQATPVISKPPSPYKEALQSRVIIPSAPIYLPQTKYWKKKGGIITGEDYHARSERIRQKIEALRVSSSPTRPVCFRCGDKGHLATDCRNAVLCFLCHRLGHKAKWCRSVLDLPPLPRTQPAPTLRKPPPTSSFPPLLPSPALPSDMHRHTPINAPVAHFFSTPDSEALEQHFRQSFFLDDTCDWGAEKIEGILRSHPHLRQYDWRVRIFEDRRYLIEAPTPRWLDQTLENGFLRLENKDFPVTAWDPGFIEGLKLISIWVKVRGFPNQLWKWANFEQLFHPYGTVLLDLATPTSELGDWRMARVRLGVCDPTLLPPSRWIMFTDANGFTGRHEVTFEIDKEAGPGHKWLSTKKPGADKDKRGPSGNPPPPPRPKERGIELRERSNAPKKTAPCEGKGKQVAVSVHDEDSDSDQDLPDHTTSRQAKQLGVPLSLLTQTNWLASGFGSSSKPHYSGNHILTTETIGPAVFTAGDTAPSSTDPPTAQIAKSDNAHSAPAVNPSLPTSPPPTPTVPEVSPPLQPQVVPSTDAPQNFPPPYIHNASSDTEPSDDYDTIGFKILSPPSSPQRSAVDISSDSSQPGPTNTNTMPVPLTPFPPTPIPPAPPVSPPTPTPPASHPASGSFTIPLSSLDLSDINLDEAMNCPITIHCKGEDQLPDLTTEGNPAMAVKLFTLLMNQLAINPPSPQAVHPPPPSPAVIALQTPTAMDTIPTRKRGFHVGSLRRSVRVKSTGEEGINILTRAQNRIQSSYNLRSGKKGIPLILNFPYTRLTTSEVASLFRAYNIRLGIHDLQAGDIIRGIQSLDRDKFEALINQAFDKLKASPSDHCLILDQDVNGILRIQ